MLVAEFNRLDDRQRFGLLSAVCSSPIWVHRLSAAAPFRDLTGLLQHADRVLDGLPEAEIDAALDGHPRIGDRTVDTESAREQAGMAIAADDVRAALAAQNRAYQQKFGYIYLVCADGRTAEQMLADLTERLQHDADTERRVMRMELAAINRLRLARLFSEETQ